MDVLPHEKVRFRRDEIADLATLPSAATIETAVLRSPRRLHGLRYLTIAVGGLVVMLLVVLAGLSWIVASGIATDRLQRELEAAVAAAIGERATATVGKAAIAFDFGSLLSVAVDDILISTDAHAERLVEAGAVRFDIALLPLLAGRVELGNARIVDAHVDIDHLPATGDKTSILALIEDDRGLVDPDRIPPAVFKALHSLFDALALSPAHRLALENLTVSAADAGPLAAIAVSRAVFDATEGGTLRLDVEGRSAFGTFTLAGRAVREGARISVLDLALDIVPAADGEATGEENRPGTVRMAIAGAEEAGDVPSRIDVDAALTDGFLDLGSRGSFAGNARLDATLKTGTGKLEIGKLRLETGRSVLDFDGAIGPKPASEVSDFENPAYRFELVSNGSTIAPVDSPEAAVEARLKVAGRLTADAGHFFADEILLTAGDGLLKARSEFSFVADAAPGIFLDMTVESMPVTHVKQLWPWFAGSGARNWVLTNFFGGEVLKGAVTYRVEPGRIGNGVPLAADEIFGRFEVHASRFDTAGAIPPIRDANGTVAFAGNTVDITLSSGSVYLPSGKRVDARNGKLAIKQANRPPVIGRLDIDVAGDAAAIAELASLEPIDAMRHVGIAPGEFTGKVTGNVKADIPLQKGIDPKTLGWHVELAVSDLAIARPLDGQKVTEARGTIVIDPDRAVIATKAKLNGIPAEIAMVEPIGRSGVKKERIIDLLLDDKTRDRLFPGLSRLVSGPMEVRVDAASGSQRRLSADLRGARLSVPWAGWEKGAGIGAKLTFALSHAGDRTTLSDFALDGDSFSVRGDIVLSGGSLASARFSRARLNRSDDVAVSIDRRSGAYDVAISGKSLDARSMIKQFLSDADTVQKTSGGDRVRVKASVGALSGFNGETLGDVSLTYASGEAQALDVKARTDQGGSVAISNGVEGGRQQVKMTSDDAGSILRFLDIYKHMEGGTIDLGLAGQPGGKLAGRVDARNFWVVDEPRLGSLVSTPPSGGDRSLNEAVHRDIDTARVKFERGFAEIAKGKRTLQLGRGILRGPLIGMSFQGTLYDQNNRMEMTGTFMPAYGLNRIFGELPLVGAILGNGRDRGLIGVTFKLEGDANKPDLRVNPLSVIAPGIFRSIFEY